jgi:cell division protein FtsX
MFCFLDQEYILSFMELTSLWQQWWMPFVIMAAVAVLVLLVKVIVGLVKNQKK